MSEHRSERSERGAERTGDEHLREERRDGVSERPAVAPPSRPRVVALGGGHGLYASLSALRRITADVTAVVTVADDGGSSGRLRRELGALPPGDLRMALSALAGDDAHGRLWAQLLQHRFGGTGALAGHPVGNLLLAGFDEVTGDPVRGLDEVTRLLGSTGRVLPMSTTPLDIVAEVESSDPDDPIPVREIHGQVAVATTPGRVRSVWLRPAGAQACAEAVAAVRSADWVLLGPGSWFSSVLPHLLLPELRAALVQTAARRVVVLNLAPQAGETDGFSAAEHLDVLRRHAPDLRLDVVLADNGAPGDADGTAADGRECLLRAAESTGARLVLAGLATDDGSARHDITRLAAALHAVVRQGEPTA